MAAQCSYYSVARLLIRKRGGELYCYEYAGQDNVCRVQENHGKLIVILQKRQWEWIYMLKKAKRNISRWYNGTVHEEHCWQQSIASFIYSLTTLMLRFVIYVVALWWKIIYNTFRATDLTFKRLLRPWYWIDSLYYLTSMGREYKLLLNALHGFTREVCSSTLRFTVISPCHSPCWLLYSSRASKWS